MDIKILIIIAAIIHFILGCIVYFRNKQKDINVSFALFAWVFGFWSLAIYFYEHPLFFSSLLWIKIVYLFVILMITTIFYFSFVFPVKRTRYLKVGFYLNIIISLVLVGVLFFTESWVKEVTLNSWGPETKLGNGFKLFQIASSFLSIWIFFNLIQGYRLSRGIKKIQVRYMLFGMIILTILMIPTNILLPLLTGESRYFWLSPILSLSFVGITTYAITRYRFMDIRVVIKKTIIYLVSFSLLISMVASLIFGANKYLLQNYGATNIIIIEVILIVIFLPILKKLVLKVINRYINKDEIDLSKNIEEFNNDISYSNYLDDLINKCVSFFKKELSIEKVNFIIRDFTKPELGYFFPLANKKILDERMQEFLVDYFNNHKEILFKQELPFIKADKKYNKDLQEISHFLRKERYEAIIAFKHWDVINGFIFLGSKNKSDVFSQEDAKLLESLANQVNIALFRVLSYEEAVGRVRREFGSSKQKINN